MDYVPSGEVCNATVGDVVIYLPECAEPVRAVSSAVIQGLMTRPEFVLPVPPYRGSTGCSIDALAGDVHVQAVRDSNGVMDSVAQWIALRIQRERGRV